MIVAELSRTNILEAEFTNEAPFVNKYQPFIHATAQYWQSVFGAPDESISIPVTILSIIQSITENYAQVFSYLDVIAQEKSWWYDAAEATIYIHHDHDIDPFAEDFEIGTAQGFTDKDVIYVDDIEYLPLIKSFPKLSKQQDIVNYKKLAMLTGNITLSNVGGILDYLIDGKIYGNDFKLYRLIETPGVSDYTHSDLIGLHCFYVDDYDISQQEVSIDLGDKRDSQDVTIPTDKFNDTDYPNIDENFTGNVIPVLYGLVRRSKAIPVNSETTGPVTYRQALLLTSLGIVEVKIEEAWVTKVPTSTSLATGSFVLAEADARNDSDVPYECRVTGSVGIPVTYASDIIKDFNDRYLEVEYLASNYDTTEWEAEEIALETAGLVLDEEKKMFEWIAVIQDGANVGFRYDFLPDGRRTIRVDDFDRAVSRSVDTEDILNIDVLPVKSNKKLLTAIAEVKYAKDYNASKFLSVIDNTHESETFRSYRKKPKKDIETILTLEAHAIARAAWHIGRFKDVPKILEATVFGPGWDSVRLFDTMYVPITREAVDMARLAVTGTGREFYGIWLAIVIGTDPAHKELKNNLKLWLISKPEPITTILKATGEDIIIITSDGAKIVIREE